MPDCPYEWPDPSSDHGGHACDLQDDHTESSPHVCWCGARDGILTASELHARLGVRQQQLSRWKKAGLLSPVNGSRPAHFNLADVQRLQATRRQPRTDPERDREIADLIAAGLSYRKTARKLGISPDTVRFALARERARHPS